MTKNSAELQICKFVKNLKYDDIPCSVIDSSKKLLLDLIGVMCLSYDAESTMPILKTVNKLAGKGDCTIIGSSIKLPSHYAALLNGTLAHSSEFDDTNGLGHSHPGAVIIPVVLAASENKGYITGKQFITAIVAGYEIMCRVGAALGKTVHHKGFHVTPISGIFGAVASIAKLLNLDEQTTHSALGLAGSFVSGSHQFSENGAWNKRLHPGLMAHHAILCIEFAINGVLGAALPLTGSRGFLKGYTEDPLPEKLDHDLGDFWYTDKTAIKPYPSCRLTHGAIDLMTKFHKDNQFEQQDLEKIDGIHIEISPRAYYATGERTDRKLNPVNIVDAQFSIYFQVAAALITGESNMKTYKIMGDKRMIHLTKKMKVEQNKNLEKYETKIIISQNAIKHELHLMTPKGEPANPVSWEEVIRKFNDISCRLGQHNQQRLIAVIKDLEALNNLDTMFSLLTSP